MRYLGEVAEQLKDKELNHLKTLIEREVVFRSAKHIFNEHIRDSPDTYLSSTISHLFNLLVAPFPLLSKLNDGTITYQDNTIQALIRPVAKESEARPVQDAQVEDPEKGQDQVNAEKQAQTKADKKKAKKKAKQQKEGQVQEASKSANKEPADLSDMLFRQNNDLASFTVDELFKEKAIAHSLLPIERPTCLSLTPAALYSRIR